MIVEGNTVDAPPLRTAGLQARIKRCEYLLFGVALAVMLADQLVKFLVRAHIALDSRVVAIPGVLYIAHVGNTGAAWGMLSGRRWLLVLFSVVIVCALAGSAGQIARRGPLVACAMGLIFGGAAGNLIDRVVSGVVTDMFDMDTPVQAIRHFPVFNVADSALTVGVVLLLVYLLLGGQRPQNGAPDQEQS